jgi:hypothetical protein
VDVIVPLRSDMSSYEEAVKLAEMAGQWRPHPTRSAQQIAFVSKVEHVWNECDAALNACVIRFFNEKKRAIDHIVLVTTDLDLSAEWIVRHYEHLLTVVLGYSLYHLFANTAAGARFADKTRQAIAYEQLKSRRTQVIVYAGGYFEIFETLSFVHLALVLSPSVQTRRRHWLEDHLPQLAKRE